VTFRCASESGLRDDVLAGTASTVRAFLLVEHAGPWGVEALRDARLPDGLGEALRERAQQTRVRILLARRPGRGRRDDAGTTVLAAYADPHAPRLERGVLADPRAVLDLDLAGLRAGRGSGLEPHRGPVFAVCTHGRHDACCAERGRPLAAAVAAAHPEATWEVSHIGGDRFAGNLLVLPDGLYYGRLDPASGLGVAAAHTAGQLDLDHLRGRSGFPMPVQAAEVALRRELGETRTDALTLLDRRSTDTDTDVRFGVGGASYLVTVRTSAGTDLHRLTCRATRENPIPSYETMSVRRG